MTQDQCLDNSHQATSNNHSTNEQVSDDLNNSKNSIVGNGVNSVQEFNVDVNSKRSEHQTDVPIVQNRTLDADSLATGKVLTTREQLTATSSDFVNLKEDSDHSVIAIDVNKRKCADNILLSGMTVITHQNSSENIRDIIANSDQVNKISSDSQLAEVSKKLSNENSSVNENSVNKSGAVKKKLNSIKGERGTEKPEDPIERLNKLRASISNALSEVKGVLKQYSTEQSVDGECESAPSPQTREDGPVRFRFVRKIRRRSAFSEDNSENLPQNNENSKEVKEEATSTENIVTVDNNKNNHTTTISVNSSRENELTEVPIIRKKGTDEKPAVSEKNSATILKENLNVKVEQNDEFNANSNATFLQCSSSTLVLTEKANDKMQEVNLNLKVSVLEDYNKNANTIPGTTKEDMSIQPNTSPHDEKTQVLEEVQPIGISIKVGNKHKRQKHPISDLNDSQISSDTSPMKSKIVKTKKIVKKERRASIAAVEINQVVTSETSNHLELELKRRPSDSGTLIKEPTRINGKIGQNTKSITQGQLKTASATKTEFHIVTEQNEAPCPLIQLGDKNEKTASEKRKEFNRNKSSTPQIQLSDSKATKSLVEDILPVKNNTTQVSNDTYRETACSATELGDKLFMIDNLPIVQQIKLDSPTLQNTSSKPKTTTEVKVAEKRELQATNEASNLNSTVDRRGLNHKSVNNVNGLPMVKETKLNQSILQINQLSPEKTIGMNISQAKKSPAESNSKTFTPSATEITALPKITGDLLMLKQTKMDQSTLHENLKSKKIIKHNVLQAEETKTELNKQDAGKLVKNDDLSVVIETTLDQSSLQKIQTKPVKTIEGSAPQVGKSPIETTNKISTPSTTKNITDNVVKISDLPGDKETTAEHVTPKVSVVPTPIISVELDAQTVSNIPVEQGAKDSSFNEAEHFAETVCTKEGNTQTSTDETAPEIAPIVPKKKRKAKRKVVIRRIKRKLSKEDTFFQSQEAPSELEICEKEIEEKDVDEESEEEAETVPKQHRSCLKVRQFEIGDVVMYAERYRKTQVKWRKGTVIEKITSISYKLNIEGEEKPAHISYIKKFTDRKVSFGGKEYLEIDYAQIEEDEEKERNYSIWNLV